MPELDSFDIQRSIGSSDDPPKTAWQELSSAFVHESRTQLKGLAQSVGAGDLVTVTPDSEHQPEGLLAQHAQMFGHAAADAIPIILTGIAVRAGFGRVLAKSSEPGLLLQRSALGLSTAETATTGLVTGALLHPTDAQNTGSLTDFLLDRTKSGASSAVSFMSINAFSHTINSAVSASDSTFARILKNPAASGMLAGIPAGLINPQIDSVLHNGRLNTDFSGTGKSVYESVLIGTAFGGLGALKGLHVAKESIDTKSSNVQVPAENYETQLKFAYVQLSVPETGKSTEHVHLSDSVSNLHDIGALGPKSEHVLPLPSEETVAAGPASNGKTLMAKAPGKAAMSQNIVFIDEMDYHSPLKDFITPKFPSLLFDSFTKDAKTYEPSMNTLKQIFGEDSEEARILAESKYKIFVKDIADYISENPDKRKSVISEKLLANEIPNIDALLGFERLGSQFGTDSSLYQFLDKHPQTHNIVNKLADFVEGDPEPRKRVINNLLESDANWREFDPELLRAEEILKKHFGVTGNIPETLQESREEWLKGFPKVGEESKNTSSHSMHSGGKESPALLTHFVSDVYTFKRKFDRSMIKLADFVEKNPESNKPVVERAFEDGVSLLSMSGSYLRARAKIESVYGNDAEVTKKLFTIESDPTDLMALAEALKQKPELTSLVTRLVNEDCTSDQLKPSQLVGRLYLEATFGEGSETVAKLKGNV